MRFRVGERGSNRNTRLLQLCAQVIDNNMVVVIFDLDLRQINKSVF